MTILALEFSSEERSVAVARGGIVAAEEVQNGQRAMAAFAMIEKVLAQARMEREEIEAVAVGLGPGSYTGVRAAIAIAQGWQLARGIKTLGVSSVAAIVVRAQTEKIFGRVNVVVNAQRGEFYFITCEITETGRREIEPLKILPLEDVQVRTAGEILIGPEAAKFFSHGRTFFPRAAAAAGLATAGDTAAGEKLEPIYLRETNFVKASSMLPKSS
jgi:tRNA threonylcarbamoyladenosine biosynthesis protein TsaB